MAIVLGACVSGSLNACAPAATPEVFGVTMVEETTCIGQGGRIVAGPQGSFCQGADL